jgi:hypothetical protein
MVGAAGGGLNVDKPYIICYGCNCWGSCDADCLENGEQVEIYYGEKKLGTFGKEDLEMPREGDS